MSNCVRFKPFRFSLTEHEADVEKIGELVKHLAGSDPNPGFVRKETPDELLAECVWWWGSYFQTLTVLGEKIVVIEMGNGRSIHTWRDLRAFVINVLNPFMKTKKQLIIKKASDESDGFRSKFDIKVNLGETDWEKTLQ